MRDFVIDANILMSVLISGKASYRPLFTHFNFMLLEFVLVEVEKYKSILKHKSKMRDEDFLQWTYFVFLQITILPQYAIAEETLKKSKHLLDNIN